MDLLDNIKLKTSATKSNTTYLSQYFQFIHIIERIIIERNYRFSSWTVSQSEPNELWGQEQEVCMCMLSNFLTNFQVFHFPFEFPGIWIGLTEFFWGESDLNLQNI